MHICNHGSKGPCRDLPLQRKTGSNMFTIFFAKALANDFEMRPPRKINVGFTKIRLSKFVIHEEWPFADKGI